MFKPINKICLSISLWSTLSIVVITLMVGGVSFFHNLVQIHKDEQSRLNIILPLFVNAMSGQLMIGDGRAIDAIENEFKKRYNLKDIIISRDKLTCSKDHALTATSACLVSEILDIKPHYFLLITSNIVNPPLDSLESFFFESLLPLIILGFFSKLSKKIITNIFN